MVASRGALIPFARGSVVSTFGPSSTMAAVRRGFGIAGGAKSFALLSVSRLPSFLRKSAVVLLPADVVVDPSPQSALP